MPNQVTNVASDDALTAIYRLEYEDECEVRAARLVERLEVTAPSMSAMLGRLARDELIALDERKRIRLTEQGLARAAEMVRRHRLAECLLVDVLGLDWWRAYEEAHLLEHALSPVTEALISARLGNPARSPAGYPIPGGDAPPVWSRQTLADLQAGQRAEVERVYEEDQELLRFFDEAGLRPGARLTVQRHQPVGGTLDVTVRGRPTVLGYEAARRVWVCPCGPGEVARRD